MSDRSRRALLRGAGVALAGVLGGCVNEEYTGGGGGTTTATPTATTAAPTTAPPATTAPGRTTTRGGTTARTTAAVGDLGTERRVGGARVTVSEAVVADSYHYDTAADQMDVYADRGTRFVSVAARTGADGPAADAFALVVDGERYGPAGGPAPSFGRPYGVDGPRRSGWVRFAVPAPLPAEAARVEVAHGGETGGWRLADRHLRRLGREQPAFSLAVVERPDRVPRGSTVEVRVTARNRSTVDGAFRGVLNERGPVYLAHPFELSIPSTELRTWSIALGESRGGFEEDARFALRTVAGDREFTVDVGG